MNTKTGFTALSTSSVIETFYTEALECAFPTHTKQEKITLKQNITGKAI